MIRTNLQFAGVAEETKVILVTSSEPGEGKTSTISNLAIVTAQSGKRVLLIDADMRKPQIHQRFQTSNLDGLSNLLIQERKLEQCIMYSGIDNLFLLSSGPIPPNPAEMLASSAFADLMKWARGEFDYIYIDAPPILAVTDALVLTRVADGTVLVVDAQRTNRNMAQRAVGMLRQVEARILGVVLNRVPRKSAGYYYYYYDSGVQGGAHASTEGH
ncbi:CpsD/CapB family tyrosine-protein kinase [Alicyclobacillus shizuokensis]|uniref:CpsD/CapB family tyrosine-protein kinase n=1 Tax=Alicyclobacillus shizuokensis TaxID=392014 RepID=UPI0009FA82C3|nr:CpsD/CapB family tyrosine-protein kinase [Alicyclobacillus shizuokensis]